MIGGGSGNRVPLCCDGVLFATHLVPTAVLGHLGTAGHQVVGGQPQPGIAQVGLMVCARRATSACLPSGLS